MEKKFPGTAFDSQRSARKDDDSSGAKTARGLSRLLVQTRALCRQSLYYQWLPAEPELTGLQSLFHQHYQSLRNAVDIITDRISALGYGIPDGFSLNAWSAEKEDARSPSEMIGCLIRNHQACAQQAKSLWHVANASGDDISTNLAAQRHAMHDRAAWLLMALPQIKRPIHYAV